MSQTLRRAISIIAMVSEEPRRISQIAEALGVHHSTALRLVHTLRDHRLLHEQGDHSYRLGSGLLLLASRALEQIELRDVAKPYMAKLGAITNETIHLGALEDGQVFYLDKVEASHPIRMYSRLGAIAPLHCSAVAKAIVGFAEPSILDELVANATFTAYTSQTITNEQDFRMELGRVRKQEYAVDREEHEIGIHCIAAPLWQANRVVRAAISITAPKARIEFGQLEGLVPDLLNAANAISIDLGSDDSSSGRWVQVPRRTPPLVGH